MSRQMHEAKST